MAYALLVFGLVFFLAVFAAFLKAAAVGAPFATYSAHTLSAAGGLIRTLFVDVFVKAHFFLPPLPFDLLAVHQLLLDLDPLHFHFFRDSRRGELGSLAALGCFFIWPADLAQ